MPLPFQRRPSIQLQLGLLDYRSLVKQRIHFFLRDRNFFDSSDLVVSVSAESALTSEYQQRAPSLFFQRLDYKVVMLKYSNFRWRNGSGMRRADLQVINT